MRARPFVLACTLFCLTLMAGASSQLASSRVDPRSPQGERIIRDVKALIASSPSSTQSAASSYVGSEYCLACHTEYSGWRETNHATFIRRPMTEFSMIPGKGVIADANRNGKDDFVDGLDFNTISSPFDAYKPNAPKLAVTDGVYTITIGTLTMPVVMTQAGGPGQGQRFIVRIPVTDTRTGLSASLYFAPLAWDPSAGWGTNSPSNWYDASNQPRFGAATTSAALAGHTGNYSSGCAGCHTTGIRSVAKTSTGETEFRAFYATLYATNDPSYVDLDGDGNEELTNIGCESCHGPGAAHILGQGDKTRIVTGDDMRANAQFANDICGRCHTTPRSTPNGTWAWPYNDRDSTDWTPALRQPLAPYMTDGSTYWPDGKNTKIGRPYTDFYKSPHPTYTYHKVICADCHNPHRRTTNERQIIESVTDARTGLVIPTSPENNTLCLSCHGGFGDFKNITKPMLAEYEKNRTAIGAVIEEHSHHPYGPERSMGLGRCTNCHMARTGGRSTLTVASHSFEAIPPEKTLNYQSQGGMPNSCAVSCHAYKVNSFGLGIKATASGIWNTAFDRDLATALKAFYGPKGTWWDTTPATTPKDGALPAH